MRGKPGVKSLRIGETRLIPAGAGKTPKINYAMCCVTAHPRRCGENPGILTGIGVAAGSSPQVRGKLVADADTATKRRLIPAGAGKTLADMELYPHIASFRISLEPKASINPT